MPSRSIRRKTLHASATEANTNEAFTDGIDVSAYTEGLVLLKTTNSSGSSPTLTVNTDVSFDSLDTWYDHQNLVTNLDVSSNKTVAYKITNLGQKVRVGYKVGGSNSPTVTFRIDVVLKD